MHGVNKKACSDGWGRKAEVNPGSGDSPQPSSEKRGGAAGDRRVSVHSHLHQ